MKYYKKRWITLTTIVMNLIVIFVIANLVQKPTVVSVYPRPQVAGEATESGILVTKVIDGDTIQLEDGKKVRYIGIDSPELKKDCFANEATAKNRQLVEGKRVQLVKDVSETDKYGRLLRYVYVDRQFVNDVLVRGGYARESTYKPDIKFQKEFKNMQKEAKDARRGLWNICNSQ